MFNGLKETYFTIKVPLDLREKFKAFCDLRRQTMSYRLRELIIDDLTKEGFVSESTAIGNGRENRGSKGKDDRKRSRLAGARNKKR